MATDADSIYISQLQKADISKVTIDNYIKGIKRIQTILKQHNTTTTIHHILHNADQVYPLLEAGITQRSSLKTTVAAILGILKHCNVKTTHKAAFDSWYRKYDPLLKELKQQEESSIPTERQSKGMVRWGDVLTTRDLLAKTEYASRDHLLLSMYTYLAPRRQEDYHRVYIITKRPYPNDMSSHPAYLDLTTMPPRLVVKAFKTAKAFSAWEKELTSPDHDDLLHIINQSIRLNPRDYLFTQMNGAPYTQVIAFTRFSNRVLKKYFGAEVSLNSLRHAAVKASLTDGDKSYNNQNTYAMDMGHSFDTHRKYNKIDPKKAGIKMSHTTTDPDTGKTRSFDCLCVEKTKTKKEKKTN